MLLEKQGAGCAAIVGIDLLMVWLEILGGTCSQGR